MQTINKFIADNKNYFSTFFAFLMFTYEPLNSYFNSQPFEWKTFIFLVFGAVVSFSIGKYPKGLVNSNNLTGSEEKQIEQKGYATSEDLKK